MAKFPSPYEFVKHAFETVQYGGKLLSEWVEEINKHTWISVEERLPEDGRYLVITQKDDCVKKIHTATYNSMGWWTYANFGEITHWMPLPEPPKEE